MSYFGICNSVMTLRAAARDKVSPAKVLEIKYSPQFIIFSRPATQLIGIPFPMALPRQIMSGSTPDQLATENFGNLIPVIISSKINRVPTREHSFLNSLSQSKYSFDVSKFTASMMTAATESGSNFSLVSFLIQVLGGTTSAGSVSDTKSSSWP